MPKILIVEDDADIAAIERDYLELSGYEVTICSDGTSGLNAALTENCDLLLLDLRERMALPSAAPCARRRISPF